MDVECEEGDGVEEGGEGILVAEMGVRRDV